MGRNKITFCKGHTINNGRVLTPEHKNKIRSALLKAAESGKPVGRPKGGVPWNKGTTGLCKSNAGSFKEGEVAWNKNTKGIMKPNATTFKKGVIPWNKGMAMPPEYGAKLRGQKRTPEQNKRNSEAQKGKKLSAEHIRKVLSRRTPTSLEMKFQGIVEKNNLPYKFVGDGSFMLGRKNPDFININGDKIAIEVYARYYKLRHEKTLEEWKKDRQECFSEYGWQVIFFDETEVNENNIVKVLTRR